MEALSVVARDCDQRVASARAELVRAVRLASAGGMTQRDIARQTGRSQPEISRLLRFHGTSPRASVLRRHRGLIRQLLADAGGVDVRVFGSVARETDQDGSDVDLLFTMTTPMSLMTIARLERRIEDLVGLPVDLVPQSALRADLRDRVLGEAVPL